MKPEKSIPVLCAVTVLALAGCGIAGQGNAADVSGGAEGKQTYQQVQKEEYPPMGEIALRDVDTLYQNDVEDSVVTMYLTVRRGKQGGGDRPFLERGQQFFCI